MTLFDLVLRSMRKNLKHYYLYFFALIVSVVLYFVFASLQHDQMVAAEVSGSLKMSSAFKAAGILLLCIAGVFVLYANSIFLKRRSREVGLYQLVGLSKFTVSRMLVAENLILGTGALAIGIGAGLLVSRVFLLLLMRLVGLEGILSLSFSGAAVAQTVLVFLVLLLLTSLQMIWAVRRSTLIALFKGDRTGENIKKPKTAVSAILAIAGIALISFGYWLSGRMLNAMLFVNMLLVLGSVILGTYLLFRVTIGWVLYQIRKGKNGHLGVADSLSIAPLMHRMKSNANSLTIITVLSAMTLTMLASSYSSYYSAEKETRLLQPYDYMYDNDEAAAKQFETELERAGIPYRSSVIEGLYVDGEYEKSLNATFLDKEVSLRVVNAEQMEESGHPVRISGRQSGTVLDGPVYWLLKNTEVPVGLTIQPDGAREGIQVEKFAEGNAFNTYDFQQTLVVSAEKFKMIKSSVLSGNPEALKRAYVFTINSESDLEEAYALYGKIPSEGKRDDYYSAYQQSLQSTGVLIFIAGFLGLVFLISTGSILYFKQMTEAEQEKASYTTLRQLGFSIPEIMKGIMKKQLFVFGLPLAIGLLHSIFAVKSASFIFMSDIRIPTMIAMGVYVAIYLVFAILTVGYYRKTMKTAL
ncbi:FtsX-like permease family protein [Sporosarcina trichiuri]|uniref:FtsX-like permease family protein n=1 Tax=Sporosarcina trichiuri TaxID=3056445 RepID=UPI0025B4200D|nr:FtsX-like permease family protein [Sporosarcina sp. 0.2-SM1T-5]WJY27603.1 FtsX-like permease family protein [Sporosarcina sp. 0.2-SM1T-5]